MNVKMFFNGVEMHVPIGEVGNVMHQLGLMPSSLNEKVPTGALSKIYAENTQSVANLQRSIAFDDSSIALNFLNGIKAAGDTGLASAEVAVLLGANHPKGIGSKLVGVNKLIEAHGYSVDSVYTNARDPLGERQWKEGMMLNSALKALEKGGPTN